MASACRATKSRSSRSLSVSASTAKSVSGKFRPFSDFSLMPFAVQRSTRATAPYRSARSTTASIFPSS